MSAAFILAVYLFIAGADTNIRPTPPADSAIAIIRGRVQRPAPPLRVRSPRGTMITRGKH